MRLTSYFITCFSLLCFTCFSQTNIHFSNQLAEDIVLGNYETSDYIPAEIIDKPEQIIDKLIAEVSAANLKDYLLGMEQFHTRHTGSDTLLIGSGIGAARAWAYNQFESFNETNGNRLIVSYLNFDRNICGLRTHKNIVAVLPGVGAEKEELVIVEAHFDSRCGSACDTECFAQGMEDNASGSALVLEMARVMSTMTFDRTIVFMLTVGEEQGLFGAEAMARYCQDRALPVHAVFNNDVIGGVICGETASPPGCPSFNHVDSINVRLYSWGTFNSKHKGLARFIKLQYHENLRDKMAIKPVIEIMSAEDRTGRGGDHIPFREKNYTTIRFTSANEHGDADVHGGYTDRQHTTNDILGVDTDNDAVIDSFFVDFNYLQRNTLLNANSAAMAASGPYSVVLEAVEPIVEGFKVIIDDPYDYGHYKIGVRTITNDFDTVFTSTEKEVSLTGFEPSTERHFFTVAPIDENGVEGLFCNEVGTIMLSSVEDVTSESSIELLQNRPNPFDDRTSIAVWVHDPVPYKEAHIEVVKPFGTIIFRTKIDLKEGMNEIWYDHKNHHFSAGLLYYRLIIDGKHFKTRSMVYAY